MILAALILAAVSVMFAAIHAHLINTGKRKKLKKWAWALLYTGIACLFAATQPQGFDWWLLANAFFIRVPFFNIPLNRFRKPPVAWFYVTPELRNVTGWGDAWNKQRFWDYLLWKLFGKAVWIPYAVCLVAAILITIIK